MQARWLIAALLVTGAGSAQAQAYPLAPLIARLPGGTRALAMANADMGGRGSAVIFYNPAQLAVAQGSDASAEFYTSGDLLVTLSTLIKLGPGAIGAGVQSLDFSNPTSSYAIPDVLGTRGPVASSGLIMAVGYAQPVLGMRAGVNVKLMEQTIGSIRDSRGSLDFGLARDLLHGTFGFSVQNMGPAFRNPFGRVSQPTRTSLGFSSGLYELGPFHVQAAATGALLRGRSVVGGGGGEISYSWQDRYSVAARGGVRRPAEGEGPWTAGLGIRANRISLDYTLESRDNRPVAQRIGVAIR